MAHAPLRSFQRSCRQPIRDAFTYHSPFTHPLPTSSVPDEAGPTGSQGDLAFFFMPSDLALRAMNQIHRMVLGATGGRLGWSVGGMPVIELTTTGRRSGQPRATMLTSPYQEGSTIIIVASRGGDNHHPAWYLNLLDHPEVSVSIGGKPAQGMRAEIADHEARERLWPLITADHRNYAGYQRKTGREIPVVLLRPVED
jgi:deazaflavin-dependent oxidoreductase (nitroreductase family)